MMQSHFYERHGGEYCPTHFCLTFYRSIFPSLGYDKCFASHMLPIASIGVFDLCYYVDILFSFQLMHQLLALCAMIPWSLLLLGWSHLSKFQRCRFSKVPGLSSLMLASPIHCLLEGITSGFLPLCRSLLNLSKKRGGACRVTSLNTVWTVAIFWLVVGFKPLSTFFSL